MARIALLSALVASIAGCSEAIIYEIDFSSAQDFQWDGKLRVTKVATHRPGPFFTSEKHWEVQRVELMGKDGRIALVDPDGYAGSPVAAIGIDSPAAVQLLGVRGFSKKGILILDLPLGPQDCQAEGESDAGSDAQPVRKLFALPAKLDGMRPFAQNADKLTVGDWWAIGLAEADHVAVDFLVPDENLRIIAQGKPDKFASGTMEVRTQDGRLLKRFEEERINVRKAEPEAP